MINFFRRNSYRPALVAGFCLILATALLGACSEPSEMTPGVVTEEITEQDETIIVTRVVRQTVQVEVTPVVETPEEPNTLDISFDGNFSSLDPQVDVGQVEVDMMENIFAGLTRFNLKDDVVEPQLATEWDISSNGLIWTFSLRDDIFWVRHTEDSPLPFEQAGDQLEVVRPVTAEDVVYAIQRACDPRVNTPDVFILFIIQGCETIQGLEEVSDADLDRLGVNARNDHTVEFRLTRPASHFLAMTTSWLLRPVPRELVEEMDEDWSLPENLWTSGPFVISGETVMDSRTVLRHNPYWPIPFEGNVDQVNILHLSQEDALGLWQDRLLDLSPVPEDEQASLLSRYEEKIELVSNQAVFYLAYNFDSPAFNIPEVRQAFSWAIDRERLVEEVHGQRGIPMRHFAPPGVIGAPPIDQVGTGYSPDQARINMSQTVFGDCRLMGTITYMISSSDLALQQAELFRDMWVDELDCNEEQIDIVQVQFGQLLASTRADADDARPDIWDLGWASYYPDENNWVGDVLHCTDSENRQRRPCSEVDDLIQQANRQPNDERWGTYRQIEAAFFGEDAIEPISPLYVRADYILKQGWLEYSPAHFGGEQYDTYLIDRDLKELERLR